MRRALGRLILAASWLVLVPGCSAQPVVDSLPSGIGLPDDAPQRPATSYQFPAVHDMPPPRANAPLSDEEQWRLEQELNTVRSRQERKAKDDKKAAQ